MAAVVWAISSFLLGVFVAGTATYWLSSEQDGGQTTVAPEMLVDAIEEALLLVDSDGGIQLTNDAFEAQFHTDGVGQHFEDALAAYPDVRECVASGTDEVVTVETDQGEMHLDISVYPVTGGDRKLALLRDVTSQHRQRQELEEQNEKLDQFASLISHDLRNPLDVAIGRANALLRLSDDPDIEPHLESIEDALMRMHRIITKVLALARQGDHIREKENVSLSATASDAWSHVQTESATLDVAEDQIVLADRDGLEHIFENLFRNSVEHGSTSSRAEPDDSVEHGSTGSRTQSDDSVEHAPEDASGNSTTGQQADDDSTESSVGVTVSVGTLADDNGFYVADDGDGIAPEKRDEVLEAGYTDSDDGTGLGLAIVTSIADAHDWDISVTESESGGARFEFTGVEYATDEFATQEQD
jgi:signal transduction histidine kinase